MKAASTTQGVRLLDVLDLHWYPEATGNSTRITGNDVTAAVQAARVQAPRSLWDSSYLESSWIASCCGAGVGGSIDLIHVVANKIAAAYAGTKIAFTEYNYGASTDISGGVAEADVLGIFGRESVFAATYWPLNDSNPTDNTFVLGAFRNFRNFDGAGANFGDTSFSAVASDNSKASVYASYDAANTGRIIVVAINKTTAALPVSLTLADSHTFTKAHAWQLTSTSKLDAASSSIVPTAIADQAVSGNAFQATLPAYSVTTYAFVP
jgi:hypothetical protein